MRKISFTLLFTLFLAIFQIPSNASTNSCPSTWNFSPTAAELSILNPNSLPEDFLSRNRISIESIQEAEKLGQQFLIFPNFSSPLPQRYYEKIAQGGRNIAISGQWKTSQDGKTWLGLRNYNGNLLASELSAPYLNQPPAGLAPDRLYPIALASRVGLTPGTRVALEVKVNVNGCKEEVFYERNSRVPSYTVETRKFDNLLELYYEINMTEVPINFLEQNRINETIKTFVDHVKDVSQRNQIWTISNTRRGVLDIWWTLTGEGADISSPSSPFTDLSVSPTKGDSCITLTTPYKSVYTYKTIKQPCSVSIDLFSNKGLVGAFEVARFNLPRIDLKEFTITCIKGKLSKKIKASNPKCPTGFKKK